MNGIEDTEIYCIGSNGLFLALYSKGGNSYNYCSALYLYPHQGMAFCLLDTLDNPHKKRHMPVFGHHMA